MMMSEPGYDSQSRVEPVHFLQGFPRDLGYPKQQHRDGGHVKIESRVSPPHTSNTIII
jgi:hypothetical protein